MTPAIELRSVSKSFRVRVRERGRGGIARHLLRSTYREVEAVRDLSFTIEPGERVCFVGPNGAGKSTTIKMLSGILRPTLGEVCVLGCVPWRERHALGYEISTVFGQRSRLWWHLPASDAFDLLARVYDQNGSAYRRRRAELVDAFGIGELITKPVRQLSLGERMRCELVAGLLHEPSILFLDEPTIGLDVVAKVMLRDLVREMSERDGSTVLLASHDTGDMERVCERVLVIHGGRLRRLSAG
jgi:ABC-2 type transport system ATP-binding protein